MKLLLLANPSAAGRRARRLFPPLREFFERRISRVEYCETQSPEEARQRVLEAARDAFERVLVAGGDGTAHAAVNALQGTNTALGILPLGHGNDLARSLGIPLDPRAAAEFLLHARDAPMDLVRVGQEVYAGIAGVGFDAETNRRANAWGGWLTGHTRYFLAGLRTLADYRPVRIELVSDTEDFTGDVMWVVVANTPMYGGGLRIAPEAALDDGLLDVCIIERMSRARLLALYGSMRRGRHLRAPGVRYFRASRVEFRAPQGAALYADGEFMARLPLQVQVQPGALRVLHRPG